MKNIKSSVSLCLFFLVTLIPINASGDVFGTDDETWERVFVDLKKINSRLVRLETSEIVSLRQQLEDLLRQIEEVKQTLPQLQGSVEMNKSETISSLNKIRTQISDLDAEVRNQVLAKIKKQNKILDRFQKEQKNLKEGLAQDIEQFEKMNKENFQSFAATNKNTLEIVVQRLAALDETTKQSFENTKGLFIKDVIPAMAKGNLENKKAILEYLSNSRESNEKSLEALSEKNKILIDILRESLKQGAETKEQIASFGTETKEQIASFGTETKEQIASFGTETKEQIASINKILVTTNNNLAVNNKNLLVADQKINKLADTLKTLQVQHSVSSEMLVALKKDLVEAGEFDQLVDKKINKLVKSSAQLITKANKLEGSILDELKQSSQKEDSNKDKINLANEKLSRLIEILKAIAAEQDKLGKVVKAQAVMSKAQAGLVKNQESIKEALADLRRKANVSISRNDDIKKALGRITKNNSDASSKSTKKAKN
jgi:ABC-type transporter Mla subunit MlaD